MLQSARVLFFTASASQPYWCVRECGLPKRCSWYGSIASSTRGSMGVVDCASKKTGRRSPPAAAVAMRRQVTLHSADMTCPSLLQRRKHRPSSERRGKTAMAVAFVTVGTTQFDDLVRAVDTPDVLAALEAQGVCVAGARNKLIAARHRQRGGAARPRRVRAIPDLHGQPHHGALRPQALAGHRHAASQPRHHARRIRMYAPRGGGPFLWACVHCAHQV